MTKISILPFVPDHRREVIDLAVRAWTGVLDKTAQDVPRFVYDNFYPDGWQARQTDDVGAFLDGAADATWIAKAQDTVVGFIGLAQHPEDRMGEIVIIAVDPVWQRHGIARRLMTFAEEHFTAAGLSMVMVETVGDSGHAPARRTYESSGYEPWPVARYFKKLK